MLKENILFKRILKGLLQSLQYSLTSFLLPLTSYLLPLTSYLSNNNRLFYAEKHGWYPLLA